METYPLIKVGKDDDKCCSVCLGTNTGTYYQVVEGTERCPRHGGPAQSNSKKKDRAMQYRSEIWGRRLKEFGNSNEVKSLRDEIGILRLLMEETLNRCHDSSQLLVFSARIQAIANDIQRLVTACDRLEKSMGEMMDKPTAIKFAGQLIEICASEIEDVDALDRISHRVIEAMR